MGKKIEAKRIRKLCLVLVLSTLTSASESRRLDLLRTTRHHQRLETKARRILIRTAVLETRGGSNGEAVNKIDKDGDGENESAKKLETGSPQTSTTTEEAEEDAASEAVKDVAKDDNMSVARDISIVDFEEEEESYSDEEDSSSMTPVQLDDGRLAKFREEASKLRQKGKEAHDEGQFETAAQRFSEASEKLHEWIKTSPDASEEFATCLLHQALCHLKSDQNEAAKQVCTQMLEECDDVAPALRARAFHRRAKAELELGDDVTALQDARSAAFLGDRKAVALYGKLMRESSPGMSSNPADMFLGSSSSTSGMSTNPLMESLLSKSTDSPLGGDSPFPTSLLSSALGATGKDGGAGGIAKSLVSSLSQKLDDEETQAQICEFLSKTSGPQLQQMAGMAGVQLQEAHANRIANFCKGVTPKLIKKTVRNSKRVIYAAKLLQRTGKLMSKYRNVIILLVLIGWAKSAILRPIPVDKRAIKRAAKEAAKAAALKATEAM